MSIFKELPWPDADKGADKRPKTFDRISKREEPTATAGAEQL